MSTNMALTDHKTHKHKLSVNLKTHKQGEEMVLKHTLLTTMSNNSTDLVQQLNVRK